MRFTVFSAKQQAIEDLRREIDNLLADTKLTIAEIFPELQSPTVNTKKIPGNVLYRHPVTGATWPGRGRKPRWLKELEAAGTPPEKVVVEE